MDDFCEACNNTGFITGNVIRQCPCQYGQELMYQKAEVLGDMIEENFGRKDTPFDLNEIVIRCYDFNLSWDELIKGINLNIELGWSFENAFFCVFGFVAGYYSYWQWSKQNENAFVFVEGNLRIW